VETRACDIAEGQKQVGRDDGLKERASKELRIGRRTPGRRQTKTASIAVADDIGRERIAVSVL